MNLNYIKSLILVAFIHSIFSFSLTAQTKTNASISGKVFDKATNQALEYATVSVINKQSGKVINGSVADVKGVFIISNLPFDTYKVNINFIGYEQITMDNITLTSDKRSARLGTVFLNPSTHSLQGVEITGDKPIVESKIDKIVYNVSNDITSQGGAAIDVLKKVPQVTVDVDGNVELQGNSNIRFLIDGKPSSVFGNSLADALASIPASQIKSIEAITSPGAKYDSQGTGGIINIILIDNKMEGANGNINLTAGSRLENGSVNLNVRHKNFGINAFFSGNAALKSKTPTSQDRYGTDTIAKTITRMQQNSISDFVRNGFRSGIGLDWDITKSDIVTGSLGYNQFGNSVQGITNQEESVMDYSSNPLSDILTVRNSNSHMKIHSLDWNLDYKKKFKKEGQELDILYNASNGIPNSNYVQSQYYVGQSVPFAGSASTNPGTDNETEISADYTQPVSESFQIETGAKMSYQNLKSVANVSVYNPFSNEYINDTFQSYHLNYAMKVYAGYISANLKLFNYLNIKAGTRYEYTDVKIDFPNTNIPSYGTLVPSVTFSHDMSKNQSVKLSYSKRIERPEYRELNPFINLSDPYNISTGNPLLKPEIGNNFELGYAGSFKKGGNIYLGLFERINSHDVKDFTTFYPNYQIGDSIYHNVSVSSRQNLGEEYNSGITVSGSYPVTSKLNLRGNLMISHRYQVTHLSTGNISTGLRTRVNLNATYDLPKDLVIEFFGFYNAASRNIQGKSPQFFIYNFAFRKLFWDKKASIGFTATNPFSKYIKQVTTIATDSYTSTSIRQLQLRSFGISFMYKFGKLQFDKKKPEEDNNDLNNMGN
ncbi:MAG TPA: outer membrane beta-barrel family protein [Bacteroidales bacterium]|nr:outer membrane beta-barrel family protein [Bacteroidales bacterium]